MSRREGRWYIWTQALKQRLIQWRNGRDVPSQSFATLRPADLADGGDLVRHTLVVHEQRVTLPAVRYHPFIAADRTWAADRRIPAREVLVVRHGQVFGSTGWVGARGKVMESLGNSYVTPASREWARVAALVRGPVVQGRSVSLTQLGFGNYFHWTLQGLPRLAMLLEHLGGPASVDHVLHSEPVLPHMLESMDRLGLARSQLLAIEQHQIVTCEELACATLVRDDDVLPQENVDVVRRLYADVLAPVADEIVYVSRRNSARRHVVNEDEVRAVVTEMGGRTFESGAFPVADQARLHSGMRVMIGVHGAEMANLAFMPATSGYLEILPANLMAAPGATLCRSRGMAYDYTVGTEPQLPRWVGVGMIGGDVRVDVSELRQRLDAMLRTISASSARR